MVGAEFLVILLNIIGKAFFSNYGYIEDIAGTTKFSLGFVNSQILYRFRFAYRIKTPNLPLRRALET